MPTTMRQSLLRKGWEEQDIAKAEHILYSEEKQAKHYGYVRQANPLIYWMGLFIAIIGNMLLSVFLIPFLLVMTSFQLYIVIATMGVVFGTMFNFLLRDIEHVDYKHHVVAGVFIPVLAIITMFVVTNIAKTFALIIKSPINQNMLIISIIYIISFTVPYGIYKLKDLNSEKKPVAVKQTIQNSNSSKTKDNSKNDFESPEEAWKVYQQRQSMDQQKVHHQLTNKYQKYL